MASFIIVGGHLAMPVRPANLKISPQKSNCRATSSTTQRGKKMVDNLKIFAVLSQVRASSMNDILVMRQNILLV